MNAKKKDGDMADETEQDNAPDKPGPDAGVPAEGQARTAPKADAIPKPPDAPRKPDAPPKGDAKVQPKAKPKGEAEPAAAKPRETKSLAEVMRLDMRARKRRRY